MVDNTLGLNIELPIYNSDDTLFNGLSLKKPVIDSVVMSLGDKISGDVYYNGTNLQVSMTEYIKYKDVKYMLVNPPTIVREGMASDNSELKGMTKYSFVFYHPMVQLSNMPFADVAVSSDEVKYLSDSKTFSWIGKLSDFVLKLNKNLQNTQWVVVYNHGESQQQQQANDAKANVLSEVLSFDNSTIGDALKTAYDTWGLPFVIDQLEQGDTYYAQGKRFVIVFGVPSNEIYQVDAQGELTSTKFVFRFGQGVGLKNESRSPKNNKIITRLAGYGSENNIPYGYPQIRWWGNQSWDYTINNNPSASNSLPIYKGIVGGQYVKLIKHPFTRTHLMPSTYSAALFNKVSPYLSNGSVNSHYDPTIELVDYIDADDANVYPNPINELAPSYEIHQFEKVKPEFGEHNILGATPYDSDKEIEYITYNNLLEQLNIYIASASCEAEQMAISDLKTAITTSSEIGGVSAKYVTYEYEWKLDSDSNFIYVTYKSTNFNFKINSLKENVVTPTYTWNDDMDDNGNYKQSYLKITLPALGFDLYACAAITQQMQINMRSGACIGCTFDVAVDWEDYKKNFYNANGDFDPVAHTTSGDGHVRNIDKYPDTTSTSITLIVQKDINTFGKLMPNIYQQPQATDLFVILGISLPTSYITNAETRLDGDMAQYLLENNVHYHEYPLKFDEHFLATHTGILAQMRNNTIVRFLYNNEELVLYIKQMTIKYGDKPLPEYNITLTDDVEIVLNQIGQVTEDVSRVRMQLSELQKYYGENVINEINNKLSRVSDDVALGRITFQQGINVITDAIFNGNLQSPDFVSGMYTGRGWKVDSLGNAEFESARVRSVLEVIELLINRLQAEEGDTLFTDNDQIEEVIEDNGTYILSLKEKWDGYYTSQQVGNVIKGIINTLAAKEAGVSDESDNNPSKQGEDAGGNKYYTSWMRVTGVYPTDVQLKKNQIRVVLYSDVQTPAQKNFAPCALMNIARWGCELDPNEQGISAEEKKSRTQRQQLFYISTSDGRIVKMSHVNQPILRPTNYGTTLGTLPDFVYNWNIADRLIDGRDYLYAQGVVVGDFIKVNIDGDPIVQYVDCGDWVDGGAQGVTPTVGAGIYLKDEHNETSLQWETHDVWHNQKKWRCQQHQPVTVGGTTTYYEPKWGSNFWNVLEGDTTYRLEFASSRGYQFLQDSVSTTITPTLYWGTENITDNSSIELQDWSWERSSDTRTQQSIAADATWNNNHQGVKNLSIDNSDMPSWWALDNRIKFICKVALTNEVVGEVAISLEGDSNGIVSITRTFAISNVGTTASETTEPTHQGSWTVSSPSVTAQYPYLWAKEVTVFTDTTKNTTKYYCIGARGDNGVDAQDIEWAFIRSKTPTEPVILNDNSYTDSNSHTYTTDGHLPHVSGNENIENNQSTYECTDDPKGVTDYWLYEWEIKRTKGAADATTGARVWNYYTGTMTMHNNYAESAFIIDIDNDNDQFGTDSESKVLVEQTRSTNVTVYDGATPQTLTSLTATLKYEDGTSVPTSVATKTTDATTGAVSVTVKQSNTANTHTEIQAHISAVCAKGTKTIVFTLYKVMSGAPGLTPIIYNVLATNKTFSFQRTDSNELTPSSRTSQINVARTEGNTTTTISSATTGLTYSWGFENEATATNAHSGLAIGTSISISNTDASSHSSVWVLLSTGDRETLTIVKDGTNGSSGTNGYNTATIFLYKRSASEITQIDWSNTLTYTFATSSLNSVPTGWSMNTIPSGSNPLYVVAATANSRSATDTIDANEWSSPVLFVENGSQGEHGLNTASIFLYQRGSSAPSKPSGTLTYTFATGVLSGSYLGSWSQTIPDTDENHYPCWVIQATAIGIGSTDTIASSEWSTQKQLVVDGANGNPGGNTATIYLYSRSKTTVDWTNTLTYTFATQSLSSVPNGWSLNTIPSGTTPVYVTAATAYSTGATDTIAYTEWATPVKFVENGAQGAHGVNTASLYLYQRASTAPNKPTGTLTYTFATGVISGSTLGNWTQTIPATDSNHYPCWVIQATAISTSDTDTIAYTEWSEQQKMVEDGAQGLPGGNTANVMLYKRSASTISSVGISSTLYYKFSTKKLYTNSACTTEATTQLNGWSLTIPSDSTNPIYVTAAIAYSTTESDNIASSEWVTPSQFTDNGTQGEHGINTAIVFIYKRASSQPNNAPTGYVRYTFADGSTAIESGKSWNSWQTTIPTSDGNPCYVRQAAALGTGTYDDIQTSEWSSVSKLVEDGDEGQSSFKSIVFKRINATSVDAPTGGSYASPVPSGWNDGIPSGEAQLWSSTRIFTSDGASPQQSAWTTPQPMTDTDTLDIEFSLSETQPTAPTGSTPHSDHSSEGWYDPSLNQTLPSGKTWSDMIWRAERKISNGAYDGNWTITRIKGEKGDSGSSPYVADIDNEMDAVSVDQFGKIPQLSLTEGSITYAAKVQTTAKLFKGSAAQSFTLKVYDEGGTEYTNNGSYRNGIKVVYTSGSQTSNLIKVYFQSAATVGDKKVFTITLNSTYSVQFTVKGVQGDVYQLLPNIDEVVFGVDGTTNQWTPTSIGVYCGYTKNVGGAIKEYVGNVVANTYKDGGAPYNIFYRYQNADSSWTSFYWNKDLTNGTISVANSTTYTAIQFVLTSATGVGSVTDSNTIDRETIQIIKSGKRGDDGTSPYFADLDNEMGGVACDSDGYTTSEQYIETNAQLFKGTAEQTLKSSGGVVCSIDGYTLYSDYRTSDPSPARTYKAVITGLGTTTANIKVYVKSGTSVGNVDIKVSLTDTNNVSRDATLTITGVRGGENGEPAVLFNLLPSVSTIKKSSDDVLTPTSLTCDVRKTTGNSTPTRATSSDGTLRYRVDGDITSTSDGTALTINTGSVNSYVATSKYITFAFFKGTTLVDKERVPIVYDGEKGDNSIRLAIDNEHEDFIYSESGKVAPSGDAESQARLYDGAEQVSASSVGWAFSFDGSAYNGVSTDYIEDALGVAKISSSGLLSVKEIGSDSVSIKVRARYPNNNSGNYYYAEFTANKTQQDKYDIIVTPNAIAYNPSSYSTQTLNISATVTNLQGEQSAATIDTSSTITTGLRVWYAWVNANGSIGSLTSLNAPSLSVTSTNCSNYAGVYFELRLYRGGSLPYLVKDHETVEFAKSQNGISPTIYMLDSSVSYITIPSDSNSATLSATVTAYQKEGTASKTTYSGAYLYLFTRTSSSVTVVDSSNSKRSSITISRSVQRTLVSVGVVMLSSYKAASSVVTDINNGAYMAIVEIPVLANGNTGGSGANAIYLDLDNEMDAILYAGNTKVGSDVTTTARLYQGGSPVSSGVTYSISSRIGCDTSTATISSNVVTVSGILSGYTRASVTVKAAYGNGEYYAVFVVDKLVDKPKYEINVDKSVIAVNRDNTSSSSEKIRVRVYKTIANSDGTTTRTNVTSLSTEGILLWQTDGSHQPEQVNDGTGASNYKIGGYYDFTASYSRSQASFWLTNTSATYSTLEANMYDMEIVPIVSVYNGQQGEKGDVARQPYEWGKWNDFIANNSNTFTVNKYESPFFTKEEEVTSNGVKSIKETKWLWVGADGEYVPPSATPATGQTKSTTPSSSDSNWEQMVTDFKYIINEATISNYAKFGSGIFDGDYAFSQYGIIDGSSNESQHYKNFRPEFFKGTQYVMFNGSKTINTTYYPSTTPYEFGKLFLDSGIAYTFKFTFSNDISNKAQIILFRDGATGSTVNWSTTVSGTTAITRSTTIVTAGDYAIRMYSKSGSFTATKIEVSADKAFRPNLYIDWLHGEIYAQLGRFVNVTVEGVMNNLIQEVTSTNYIDKLYRLTGSTAWLDVLSCGSVIRFTSDFFTGNFSGGYDLYLPCACRASDVDTSATIQGIHSESLGHTNYTLDDVRQCVGKKLYIINQKKATSITFHCLAAGASMLVLREHGWDTLDSLTEGSSYIYYNDHYSNVTRLYGGQYTRGSSSGNGFFLLECKMGRFNDAECIYWEITASPWTLDNLSNS